MSRVACIVQARLGSTRLPAKVLLPLPTGRTVLEEVLHRCKQIKGVDVVVLATPDTPENDILTWFAWKAIGVPHGVLTRGPEHDVLARYAKAAVEVDADVIMRVTADCPLIDPYICGQVLKLVCGEREFASNNEPPRSYPIGFDCEVFSRGLLMRAHEEAADPDDREHVGIWMRRNAKAKRCLYADESELNRRRSHLQLTLDTLEDYVRIYRVFEEQAREVV